MSTQSPAGAETIPVTVRLNVGSTNIARASSGPLSKLASSTCDGRDAALRAAAKYFACREREIKLTLLEQGDSCSHGREPARYMAERKAATPKFTAIEIDALHSIWDGADVFSPALARTLRDLQQRHPTFMDIRPAAESRDGIKPYFGAILTGAGRAAIDLRNGGLR